LVADVAKLAKDMAAVVTANGQLRNEVQAIKTQSKLDIAKIQSEAAAKVTELQKQLKSSEALAKSLARQVSTQQLYIEETTRSDGHSGIKRNRGGRTGTKAYFGASVISGSSALSAHDHSNIDRTVGSGEFIAVLNGVEFRTRHNDYKMVMPSKVSKAYQATENIPYPGVPPEVLAKKTLKEQMDELKEWFKAWKFQNPRHRDYTKYFKAALCYLEGSWTYSGAKIDEPFQSDRHAIDATSWFDLQEKIAFTSHTGRKSNDENFAFLPTKIFDFNNETIPVYAQWNYRILCNPVSFDVPTRALQAVDDVATRMRLNLPYSQLQTSRAARFVVGPDGNWRGDNRGLGVNSLLDRMMKEIPGLDNYGSTITDDAQFTTSMEPGKTGQTLNAAYYRRWTTSIRRDAMGQDLQSKGFNDANLYVALTTQPKVVPKSISSCYNRTTCATSSQRITYAIPLEIVYMTPLQSWNPYNLVRHDRPATATDNGKRNGKLTPELAFNGTSLQHHYLTPEEFFTGGEVGANPADTTRNSVGILDPKGVVRSVSASGIRLLLPEIPGVGVLRQRYPIFPVHEEGSHTFIEVEALKELLMDQARFTHLYRNPQSLKLAATNQTASKSLTLITSVAPRPTPHDHVVELDDDDIAILDKGGVVEKFTTTASGHTHSLSISATTPKQGPKLYRLVQCDGKAPPCWDGHETVKVGPN